jgi:hypothetical protein
MHKHYCSVCKQYQMCEIVQCTLASSDELVCEACMPNEHSHYCAACELDVRCEDADCDEKGPQLCITCFWNEVAKDSDNEPL